MITFWYLPYSPVWKTKSW